MPSLNLSVLYTQWPGDLPRLVPALDALGYHRFWASEHHHPTQSASPILAATAAAGLSKRMRVGTAGVMIQVHSPLRVAEDFRLLETLYPGRIDLGLIGSYPHGLVLPGLLDGRPMQKKEAYATRVAEVARLIRRQGGGRGQLHGTRVGPVARQRTYPQFWLCGTSAASAALAGRLGMAYAFHHQINERRETPLDGPAVLAAYRDAFVPDERLSTPRTTIACYGLCAETEAEARSHWNDYFTPKHTDAPAEASISSPSFLGTPAQCREQLLALQHRYATDEVVLQMCARPFDVRLHAYSLLAEAFDLPVATGPTFSTDTDAKAPVPASTPSAVVHL